MNEFADIRQLPIQKFRKHTVMVGQGEVGFRRWNPRDREDMTDLFGIMHRRKVKENFNFEGETAQKFGNEFKRNKETNSFNYAVTHGVKRYDGVPGKAGAFVYFHFDADDRKEYERYVEAGIMPPLRRGRKIYEVGYAKSKTGPTHFTNRGLMQACFNLEKRLRRRDSAYHDLGNQPVYTKDELKDLTPIQRVELFKSREPQRHPKYTADELSRMTPAERILLDSPVDMIIYAWVGETKRRVQDMRTGKSKTVFEVNQESVNLANSSGFIEVGTVPDDEMPGGKLHVFLLDWRKVQQIMHDRADQYILQATGKAEPEA